MHRLIHSPGEWTSSKGNRRRRRKPMLSVSSAGYKIIWTRFHHQTSRRHVSQVERCTRSRPPKMIKALSRMNYERVLRRKPEIILSLILWSSRTRSDRSTNRCQPFRSHRRTITDPPSASCVALGFYWGMETRSQCRFCGSAWVVEEAEQRRSNRGLIKKPDRISERPPRRFFQFTQVLSRMSAFDRAAITIF